MGTRNITRVIANGKRVCNQYGQWDGYPTSAGKHILEWIKNGKFDILPNCTLNVNDGKGRYYYTGAPATEELNKMIDEQFKLAIKYHDEKKADEEIALKYGIDKYLDMWVASRDTGVDILNISKPMTLWTDEYCNELEAPDWQIEAINVIDLDNKIVTMMWHGNTRTYSFERVNKMDIEKEMTEFESEE